MRDRYDAIVVGGGHNGLVNGAYLAKGGLKTLILERRHLVGGAAITEELHPGYWFTTFSYALSLLRPQIIQELELTRHPAPPVGPALGQHGVNIMEFCKAFNAQTQQDAGTIIPVEITVYEDRSFTFITKTPPAAVLIKQAIGLDKGSGEPNRNKVGTITKDQVRQIAEQKLPT